MTDLTKVKDKIRKLLAIAADDANADGEVEAAWKLACAAMQAHQLTEADIEAEARQTHTERPEQMDTAQSSTKGRRGFTTWEQSLAWAVRELVGSVQHYISTSFERVGLWGDQKRCGQFVWYGPAEDVQLAAELFDDWRHVIATMAQGRYGGVFRGEGARYAYGFACGLHGLAMKAANVRKEIVTDSTRALAGINAIVKADTSLAAVLAGKRKRAVEWLAKEKGIKLGKGRGGRGLGFNGSGHVDAFHAGKADGARADFTATRKAKLT